LKDYVFFPACAVHLALLDSATWAINVLGSNTSLERWAHAKPQMSTADLIVVNRSDPPDYLHPINVPPDLQESVTFMRRVESLLPFDARGTFFVERSRGSFQLLKNQKLVLEIFEKLAATVTQLP
jgi:hypothetical protein